MELHRQHLQGREKQTYFLLAAAGACIAFSLTQTREVALSLSQIPLAAAVAAWAVSFLAGCLGLQMTQGVLNHNLDLLKVQKGSHHLLAHPSEALIAEPIIRKNLERASAKAARRLRLQFSSLVFGALAYVAWHVIEMYLRR